MLYVVIIFLVLIVAGQLFLLLLSIQSNEDRIQEIMQERVAELSEEITLSFMDYLQQNPITNVSLIEVEDSLKKLTVSSSQAFAEIRQHIEDSLKKLTGSSNQDKNTLTQDDLIAITRHFENLMSEETLVQRMKDWGYTVTKNETPIA